MTEPTVAVLKAEALKWKCRAYSFAAMPFVMLIGLHVISKGAMLPLWTVAIAAAGMGGFGALSTSASFDHRNLTGKLVWF